MIKLYKVKSCEKCPSCQWKPELQKVVCLDCFDRPIDVKSKLKFPTWCPLESVKE